jgi:LAO/AO transport system kinase
VTQEGEPKVAQTASHEELAQRLAAGDVRAVARACRMVDERWPGHLELLRDLFPSAQSSWWLGITGSPGVGKSTLTSRLVQHLRAAGERVGVVAVDPSSPFSGGALLGDRIRMQSHWDDPEVFIRSVATRGAVGGLSRTTADIARVLAAWGARVVLIETVGVGQDELDVMHVADTTLVVQAPGAGDDLQAAKAGLLECADVLVVNKADVPGADSAVQHLRGMLALGRITGGASAFGAGHLGANWAAGHGGPSRDRSEAGASAAPVVSDAADWEVPVSSCVATRDEGVGPLLADLRRHFVWLTTTPAGQARRLARSRLELRALLRERLSSALFEGYAAEIEALAERVSRGELDPWAASQALLSRWKLGGETT